MRSFINKVFISLTSTDWELSGTLESKGIYLDLSGGIRINYDGGDHAFFPASACPLTSHASPLFGTFKIPASDCLTWKSSLGLIRIEVKV